MTTTARSPCEERSPDSPVKIAVPRHARPVVQAVSAQRLIYASQPPEIDVEARLKRTELMPPVNGNVNEVAGLEDRTERSRTTESWVAGEVRLFDLDTAEVRLVVPRASWIKLLELRRREQNDLLSATELDVDVILHVVVCLRHVSGRPHPDVLGDGLSENVLDWRRLFV